MIVAGFGFRAQAELHSLQDALAKANSAQAVTDLATLSDKADSPAFQDLAHVLGLPVHHVSAAEAANVQTQTQSAHAKAARETGSVAEAAALVAAGPGAELVQARVISADRMATCAVARARGGAE